MRVKIYDVRVPDSTTRFFQVPEYDVPIIRRLWNSRLKPDVLGNRLEIQVIDQGVVEARSLFDEKRRIRRDWGTSPDNSRKPAWEEVYPTDRDFHDAYEAAVEACAAEENRRKVQPPVVPTTVEAPAIPRPRRGGRPRKTPASDLFQKV